AERFVEGGDLDARRIEQLRLERIENRVPELMTHDVGALTRKDGSSRSRSMEKLQALAVIEGVEVGAEIEVHRQDRAHLPRYPRQQCPPEIRAATQCFGGSPVAKLCSSRRMRLGVRSRGRVRNSDRKRRIPQNGDRPLDDLASARLSTGAGIVLPSVDHALRLRPAFRGCRTRPDFALTTRSRRLRRALGSLRRHLISPLLRRRPAGEEPAAAASPLWSITTRYRGEVDHVGLKDRSTDDRDQVWRVYGLSPLRKC